MLNKKLRRAMLRAIFLIAGMSVFALKKAKKSSMRISKKVLSKFCDFGMLRTKKLNTKFKRRA